MNELITFSRRMLMVGFGSIGRGSLPLILRSFAMRPDQISVIAADADGLEVARSLGVSLEVAPLTPGNYAAQLARQLGPGDFLLNASVNVSSVALIGWCLAHGVHYIDASLEPWDGAQTDESVPAALRSHYACREQALALRARHPKGTTCVLTHGANPGLVSHFVKQAVQDLCEAAGIAVPSRPSREEWAALAQRAGVKVIHVAERDSQHSRLAKMPGEFVNTWSCTALRYEALQPAELGWGTHEAGLPPDGRRFGFGCDAAIYLDRAGLATRIRSWVPHHGPFHGWLISHDEAISISDYFTVRSDGQVAWRPTCHYVYHPCDSAALSLMELHERDGRMQERTRVMQAELSGGIDELGVLLMGPEGGAYWYGSQLELSEARRLMPHNNATTLQVNAGYVAGIAWAIAHPDAGIVEPEEMDHRFVLDFAAPYLGRLVGVRTDWTPLPGRDTLRAGPVADGDPWQFQNFRIT
jgi:homospermidine synthase